MIYENLSLSKKRFLNILGIQCDDDFPKSFYEIIKSLKADISDAENFSIGSYHTCYCHNEKLDLDKLVGTDHERYAGKSWIEAFADLDRGDKNIELFFQNMEYYHNDNPDDVDMGTVEKDGKYYIYSKAGGGNNRLIMLKIFSLAQKEKGGRSFLPLVRVRSVPQKEVAENIFYCMFPNGGYTPSGLDVVKMDNTSPEDLYYIKDGFFGPVLLENVPGNEILIKTESIKPSSPKR